MNSADAGILSSARFRFAIGWRLLLQVRARPMHPARRGRLELLALALGRGHPVLNRFSDRVLRVGHDRSRALGGVSVSLHGLAATELARLAAQPLHLLSTGPPSGIRADR